jgi:hypothetical protein
MLLPDLLLKQKADGTSEERIQYKVDGYERILGIIDACFSDFAQIAPTDEEMLFACEACDAMMHEWRAQYFKIPRKAHICECRLSAINEDCGGIGRMDESFVERYYHFFHRAHQRLINIPDRERNALCPLRHEAIATDIYVSAHLLQANKSARRVFKYVNPNTSKRRKVE